MRGRAQRMPQVHGRVRQRSDRLPPPVLFPSCARPMDGVGYRRRPWRSASPNPPTPRRSGRSTTTRSCHSVGHVRPRRAEPAEAQVDLAGAERSGAFSVLVAELDGEMAGFASLSPVQGAGRLPQHSVEDSVYVAEPGTGGAASPTGSWVSCWPPPATSGFHSVIATHRWRQRGQRGPARQARFRRGRRGTSRSAASSAAGRTSPSCRLVFDA